MDERNPKFVEKPVRLSTSKFWQIQHNYFTTFGIDAFRDDVPFYISSNAFIGEQYAQLVINYLMDLGKLNPKKSKFYLLELGCGTGKFGFYFLKYFNQLLIMHEMANIEFCYIMSDSAEKNIEYCQKNQNLLPFVESNQLDFSCYNIENEKDFYLKIAKQSYSELRNDTPLIVISNYVFDSIRQDAFEVNNGKMQEVNYGLTSRYKNFNQDTPRHLNELKFTKEKVDIQIDDYYEELILNSILKNYTEIFKEDTTQIMVPLGAIRAINNFREITNNQYFMIVGDKGVTQLQDMPLLNEEYIVTYDGCYSFQVNFDAISRLIGHFSGDSLLTKNFNDFKVNLFSSNIPFSKLILTKTYFLETVEQTGPDEYCYIYDEFLSSSYRFFYKTIISFIRFSRWDPNGYAVVHNRLMELLPGLNPLHIQDLKKDLIKIRENIYRLDVAVDVNNLLGVCYFELGMKKEALEMFLQSLEIYGDKPYPHHHAARVYEDLDNPAKALEHYTKAFELNKNDVRARRKIYQLSGKPHLAAIYPLAKGLLVFILIVVAVFLITR